MRWRRITLAAGLIGIGFAAGVMASPHLRASRERSTAATSEPQRPVAHARAAARAPERSASDGQQAAKLLLAATNLAEAHHMQPPPAAASGSLRLADVPGAVGDAVARLAAGRPVKERYVQRRLRNDHEVWYAIKADIAGIEHHLDVDERGTLLMSEVDLGLGEIPPTLVQHINAAFPGAVLLEAKKVDGVDPSAPFYEVDVRLADGQHEIRIRETGEVLRDKVK